MLMENDVLNVARQQIYGIINKDFTKLKQIIAPQAQFSHITGVQQSRDEWLYEIKIGRMHYYSSTEESANVVVNDKHAEVVMREQLDARIYGIRNIWSLENHYQLAMQDGQWKIVAAQANMY